MGRKFYTIYNRAESPLAKTEDTDLSLEFVKKLVEFLEQRGHSGFYADRDARPGTNVFRNLQQNIQNSDKTLLVVTPGFYNNTWGVYSTQRAIKDYLDTKKTNKVIPIGLGIQHDLELQDLNITEWIYFPHNFVNEELDPKFCIILEALESDGPYNQQQGYQQYRERIHATEHGDNLRRTTEGQLVAHPNSFDSLSYDGSTASGITREVCDNSVSLCVDGNQQDVRVENARSITNTMCLQEGPSVSLPIPKITSQNLAAGRGDSKESAAVGQKGASDQQSHQKMEELKMGLFGQGEQGESSQVLVKQVYGGLTSSGTDNERARGHTMSTQTTSRRPGQENSVDHGSRSSENMAGLGRSDGNDLVTTISTADGLQGGNPALPFQNQISLSQDVDLSVDALGVMMQNMEQNQSADLNLQPAETPTSDSGYNSSGMAAPLTPDEVSQKSGSLVGSNDGNANVSIPPKNAGIATDARVLAGSERAAEGSAGFVPSNADVEAVEKHLEQSSAAQTESPNGIVMNGPRGMADSADLAHVEHVDTNKNGDGGYSPYVKYGILFLGVAAGCVFLYKKYR